MGVQPQMLVKIHNIHAIIWNIFITVVLCILLCPAGQKVIQISKSLSVSLSLSLSLPFVFLFVVLK